LSYYNLDSTDIARRKSLTSTSSSTKASATEIHSATATFHSIAIRPLHTNTNISASFGTTSSTNEKQPGFETKQKSPHSKLLRVCSAHNANSHFAAIEADLLRLNWKVAMENLVNDWSYTSGIGGGDGDGRSTGGSGSGSSHRYGDFIELERNVTNYVMRNLKDCWHYHGDECVAAAIGSGAAGDSAAAGGGGREEHGRRKGQLQPPPSLSLQLPLSQSALLRLHLFPYERIITSAVHKAIALGKKVGGNSPTPSNADRDTALGGGGGGNNKQQRTMMTELQQRAQLLFHASQLLDAMSNILLHHDDDDDEDDTAPNQTIIPKSSSSASPTNHHTSCSNCHRLLLSGWLILYRQWKEWNRQMLADPLISAKDVFDATSIFTSSTTNNIAAPTDGGDGASAGGGMQHPLREVHLWAKRWLDFCDATNGGSASRSSGSRQGVLPSDKALLDGIVTMFTTTSSTLEYHGVKNGKHQREYEALYDRINNLFPRPR
jgi:hypothetical protein